MQIKDLIVYIVSELVDSPDEVAAHELESTRSLLIELSVSKQDFGRVIGKKGRNIYAIRTIINGAAAKLGKRAILDIIE